MRYFAQIVQHMTHDMKILLNLLTVPYSTVPYSAHSLLCVFFFAADVFNKGIFDRLFAFNSRSYSFFIGFLIFFIGF